jgi:hypothetical protein
MSEGANGSDNQGFAGQLGLTGRNSEGTRHRFKTKQILGEQRTHFTGKIVAVHNRNSLTEPCTVDIQPTVKQMDGAGKAASHGTIYGIPVPRNQSGDSVVVNDPQVGDVGHFSVLDRDHSSAQANDWAESNPGSFRRGTMSDAIFQGTLPRKAQAVKQHIVFDETGVTITQRDGHTIKMTKDGINLNGVKIDKDGNLTAPGKVVAGQGTGDQVSLQTHLHGSGPAPTPGS